MHANKRLLGCGEIDWEQDAKTSAKHGYRLISSRGPAVRPCLSRELRRRDRRGDRKRQHVLDANQIIVSTPDAECIPPLLPPPLRTRPALSAASRRSGVSRAR